MALDTYATTKKVKAVYTKELQVGDVIQNGNCIHGFWTFTIANVEQSPYSLNKMAVTYLYDHGGTVVDYVGKNARWYVVQA